MTDTPASVLRESTSQLVRVCPIEGTWQEGGCGWDECNGKRHRFRRTTICATCSQCYLTKKEFDSHECFDAY